MLRRFCQRSRQFAGRLTSACGTSGREFDAIAQAAETALSPSSHSPPVVGKRYGRVDGLLVMALAGSPLAIAWPDAHRKFRLGRPAHASNTLLPSKLDRNNTARPAGGISSDPIAQPAGCANFTRAGGFCTRCYALSLFCR
jgi:hypothetical protein